MSELAFEGRCAAAIASGAGRAAPLANPKYTFTKDGITYGFATPMAQFVFELLPGSAKRAHRAWNELGGSPSSS